MRTVDEIADQYVEDLVALSPYVATFLGVRSPDRLVDDMSPAGFEAEAVLARRTATALRAAETTEERERGARDAMLERLDLVVERHEAGDTFLDLKVLHSKVHMVRMMFDLMPIDGEQEASHIADTLAAIPEAFAQYAETLRAEAAAGRVAARRQVTQMVRQCENWTGASGDDFWTGLAERITVDGAPAEGSLADALRRGADVAREATAQLAAFLRDELAPQAPEQDAVGRERYARASREFIGSAIDLEETYAWGWEELARIEEEMAAVADQILTGASVDEAIEHLDADPDQTVDDKHAFRDWMQELADRTLAAMADTHFEIPEQIRRIECMIAPTEDGPIYYTRPSEDFSRPGRMWWSVPSGQEAFTKWREVTTVYHEGVPGHHLQIGQTLARRDLLNRYQRSIMFCSGHMEGWALYAERLMDELGAYDDDPAGRLGMLDGQAFRAARVVVDIGLHCHFTIPEDNPFGWRPGESWDAEKLFEFMRTHCRMEEDMLRFECNRYLGWPGQAPSYKVGERLWRAAREEYRQRKGAAFDLRQFHTDALNLGVMGLDPFTDALRRL